MLPDEPDMAPVDPWTVSRAYFAAGAYVHPPSGLLQLRVVRSGSSRAAIDLGAGRREVFTRPGDLLITLPDRSTEFEIAEGRELTIVQMSPDHAEALLRQLGHQGLDVLLPLIRKPIRDPLVAELLRRLEEPNAPATLNDWTLGVVLGSLARKAAEIAAATKSGVLTRGDLRIVDELIAGSPGDDLSVARLAGAVGLPPRRFSTEFREATGLPVHQYVLRARAERAIELLTDSDLPLSQVAVQAGFSHQAHMSRVLSRLRGRTPGDLRSGRDVTARPT